MLISVLLRLINIKNKVFGENVWLWQLNSLMGNATPFTMKLLLKITKIQKISKNTKKFTNCPINVYKH